MQILRSAQMLSLSGRHPACSQGDGMSPQSCAVVCLSLMLVGRNLGFLVEIPQDAVNGTMGQSVLLPVSYRCNSTSCFPLSIKWTFDHPLQRAISCVVQKCSLDDGGAPKNCYKKCYPYPAYWGRVKLFPENASLLLLDLRLRDSGVYTVSFVQQKQSRHITLTVLEQPVTPDHSSNRRNLGFLLEIPQDAVTGTVGQSVLLPVSYRFNSTPHFPMNIKWTFGHPSQGTIACTVHNCSLDDGGAPKKCSFSCFSYPARWGRVELFPENASLLLRDLRLSDSGVYTVSLLQHQIQIRNITLTVLEQPVPTGPTSEGRNLGFLLEIPQDAVTGTVGQSVLLPISYRCNSTPCFPMNIKWTFGHPSQIIIACSVQNCSLDDGGAPKNCTKKCYPYPAHWGRVVLFPENASLLLRDLRLSDSGVYTVSFLWKRQSRHITLTVLEQPVPTDPTSKGQNLGFLVEIPQDAVTGNVGQSVLLPVSYRCNSTSCFPMSIRWIFGHTSQRTIFCSVQNCSLDDGGTPKNCSTNCFPHPVYSGRVELFPENASLLLQDLRLSDSGVYTVSFQQHQRQSRNITLTVLQQPVPTDPTSNRQNLGFLLEIPQDAVTGTVGQSVLLPVSYRCNSTPHFPMNIKWTFGHTSQVIIACTVQKCSLDDGGAPKKCTKKCYPNPAHSGRVELFPENASLLLRDLRLSDSGVYTVSFLWKRQIRHITLTVLEQPVTTDPTSKGQNLGFLVEIPQDAVTGTVGQSVLLPVSYRCNSTPHFPMNIKWTFGHTSQVIIACTVQNCSLGDGGAPKNCSTTCFTNLTHSGRVELFPENASLLLQDLRLSDSGVYTVSFQQHQRQIRHITLTVLQQPVPTDPTSNRRNLGFLVEIPQDAVNGTVGQSVLLPVSYRFNSTPCFPVAIRWMFGHTSQRTISCTVQNCSLDDGGAPKNCSTECYPYPAHSGRVELFPKNASLLLRDLRLSDSGVYTVILQQHQIQIRNITLTVLEQPVPTDPTSKGISKQDHIQNYIIGASSLIFLLLFLVFCVWRWGTVQKKKMRIVKQQQEYAKSLESRPFLP
ncbi:carcinoembryonic antigen-related cell adhesion molecule 5-like isoform X3 [Anas acuta]|uniref:carcinoembryonic antigen-related cell adhesion molecule 5-like isoform X3 n=1 Tax=Anas acuta TaxID=28680 RepID=UPI0035C91CBD